MHSAHCTHVRPAVLLELMWVWMHFGWLVRLLVCSHSHIHLEYRDTTNTNESHDQRNQGTNQIYFSVPYICVPKWIYLLFLRFISILFENSFSFFFFALALWRVARFISKCLCSLFFFTSAYIIFDWHGRYDKIYMYIIGCSICMFCCCCSMFISRYFISEHIFSVHRIIFLLLLVIDVCSLETLI